MDDGRVVHVYVRLRIEWKKVIFSGKNMYLFVCNKFFQQASYNDGKTTE